MSASRATPIDRVLDTLADHGCAPKKIRGGWACKCPAHPDRNPSLSVTESETGNVLLHCHAGCLTSEVTRAVGLDFVDLFPEKPPKVTHIRDGRRFKARYIYTDKDGTILFSVVRYEPKTFRQYRMEHGSGEWVPGIDGVERVLYKLPQVLRAKDRGDLIWIAEGEKDVEALDHAWGMTATCNPGGADPGNGGKWLDSYTETLRGATRVVIVSDRDEAGRRHARYLARQLKGVVGRVGVFEPCTGKDVADHIRAGHKAAELVKVWDSNDGPDEWLGEAEADESLTEDVEQREATSWAPVDLTDAVRGVPTEPPVILTRSDDVKLLYPGRIHWFQGEPESLKTWAALAAVAETIQNGEPALFIDFEDDDKGVVSRLLALGLTPEQILEDFTYIHPEEPLRDGVGRATAAEDDLCDVLEQRRWALIVIDGVTEAMTVEGLDLNSNSDVATFMRRLPKRLAAEPSRPPVVCLDHVTKSTEGRGRWAIGGQHKLAGITGATYSFDVVRPLSRALLDPVEAIVNMTVQKDRPGHVRAHAIDKLVAIIAITAYPDGGVSIAINPPSAEIPLDFRICREILSYLKTYDGAAKGSIEAAVKGGTTGIRVALQTMKERGWVDIDKKGTAHWVTLTEAGRAEIA